ncbi:MAG: hypothetical protein ACE5FC_10130 [Myxococcota bacterium]
MTAGLIWLVLISGAFCYPAWRIAKARGTQSVWLFFLPAPAVALWIALTAAQIGAQSLSNLIEVVLIIAFGIMAAYVRVIFLDAITNRPGANTAAIIFVLAALALALRLLMPTLPE